MAMPECSAEAKVLVRPEEDLLLALIRVDLYYEVSIDEIVVVPLGVAMTHLIFPVGHGALDLTVTIIAEAHVIWVAIVVVGTPNEDCLYAIAVERQRRPRSTRAAQQLLLCHPWHGAGLPS